MLLERSCENIDKCKSAKVFSFVQAFLTDLGNSSEFASLQRCLAESEHPIPLKLGCVVSVQAVRASSSVYAYMQGRLNLVSEPSVGPGPGSELSFIAGIHVLLRGFITFPDQSTKLDSILLSHALQARP